MLRARLLSLLLRPTPRPLAFGIVFAAALIVAETLLAYPLERVTPANSLGVLYLLGVLVVSTGWGFRLGAATALVSAGALDYFHIPPVGTLLVPDSTQWGTVPLFFAVALVVGSIADLARSSREELRVIAEQQAALRRVATLVARRTSPTEVFVAVTSELGRLLGEYTTALVRYEPDGTATQVSARSHRGTETSAEVRFSLEGENLASLVLRTRRAARIDSFEHARGPRAASLRERGFRSGVGAPIVVEGRLWGATIALSSRPEPLPPDMEARMVDFTELVATAIANADSRAQLTASRARIVAAADDARRRLERDLHDGTQQRLVSLGLELRMAEASVPSGLDELKEQLSHTAKGLAGAFEDLLEVSRGIHPAILSKGGLGPALKTLARRSAVPVELDVGVDRRLPEYAEVAAYYVVSEALTNAAKHAQASEVRVCVDAEGAILQLSIRDDGIGGADWGRGSGLIGLRDRVEALGGQMEIASPTGSGTSLLVTIPIEGG
jgi:signal transduction histidine kinase